jgi:hypothetical protein
MTKRVWISIAAGLGLGLGVAGVVTATATSQTSTSTTITACAHKKSGDLRLANKCRPGEKPVSWNTAGPAGPRGHAGPSALQVKLREVTRTFTVQPVKSGAGPEGVAATCKAGETVLSGGLTQYGSDLVPLRFFTSGPFFDGQRSGWTINWINPTDKAVTAEVTMSALCTAGKLAAGH